MVGTAFRSQSLAEATNAVIRALSAIHIGGRRVMAKYIPSPRDWVREQVELYESSGGTKGTTLRDRSSAPAAS